MILKGGAHAAIMRCDALRSERQSVRRQSVARLVRTPRRAVDRARGATALMFVMNDDPDDVNCPLERGAYGTLIPKPASVIRDSLVEVIDRAVIAQPQACCD
ncbi:MAG: hypothetical protein AAFR04_05830 [Pseudomonadota bacterium]